MASSVAWAIVIAVSIAGMGAVRASAGYQGCFRELSHGRALNQTMLVSDSMTNEACESFCSGFRYYATEHGDECFCGSELNSGAYQVPDSACSASCAGDSQQICGGINLLSVYKSNFTSQEPLYNYTYLGCAAEPENGRALEEVITVSRLTTHKCLVVCSYGGFEWAGLEYGNECWCGHTLSDVNFNGTCNMPCSGNDSDTCGGSFSLDLYTKST